MDYTFTLGESGVHQLTASYALLTRAFGDDGTVSRRDTDTSACRWVIDTPHGVIEVYDNQSGLDRGRITKWSVQAGSDALGYLHWILDCYFAYPEPGDDV